MLRRIFGRKKQEVTGSWSKLYIEGHHNCTLNLTF